MSRFFGAIYKFRHEEDKLWHTRLVALLYWAILAGKFSTAKLNKLDAAAGACRVKVSEAEEAMPVPQGNNDLGQLRKLCDNGLHMAVVVYSNMENLLRMRIINTMTRPVSQWHSEQNRRLRTVGGASTWLMEQCSGAFFDTVLESLSLLSNHEGLEDMGFALKLDAFTRGLPSEHPAVISANELATFAASLLLTLGGCRLRRCLWLIAGWPIQFCLLGSEEAAVRTRAADKLKADHANYEWAQEHRRRSTVQILRRSCFQTASVQQLVEVMKSTGWEVTPQVKDFSLELSKVILSSQIVEDGFCRERRSEQGGMSKIMSNTRVHSVLIEKHVLDQVHHYTPVEGSAVSVPRASALPEHAYKSLQEAQSMNFKTVQGFNATPTWYTAGASNAPQKFADLALLEECKGRDSLDMVDTCWLSCLLDSTALLVKRKVADSKWMFSLGTLFSGMGALGWPAQLHSGQEDEAGCTFVPDLSPASKALHWLFIDDLSNWEARELRFMSPLWCCLQPGGMKPSIVAQAGKTESLLTIAARQAFWHIPKPTLVKLSEEGGLPVETSWSLFGLL